MRETITKIALTPAVLLVTAEVHELPTATYDGCGRAINGAVLQRKYQRVWFRRPV